jgi:hypothetical protein
VEERGRERDTDQVSEVSREGEGKERREAECEEAR